MKTRIFVFLLIVAGFNAIGQTNKIVFSELLSCSNTVLMTEAEFRCTSGTNIFFMSNGNYQRFAYTELNSNVLTMLGLSADKLRNDELLREQNNAAYRQAQARALARDAAVRAEQIRRAQMEAQAEAQAHLKATIRPQPTITISHTHISGGDALSGYEYTTGTTTYPPSQ